MTGRRTASDPFSDAANPFMPGGNDAATTPEFGEPEADAMPPGGQPEVSAMPAETTKPRGGQAPSVASRSATMKFPIRCMACGNTGSVSDETLARTASGHTLRCNVCRSDDLDLNTAASKMASDRPKKPTFRQVKCESCGSTFTSSVFGGKAAESKCESCRGKTSARTAAVEYRPGGSDKQVMVYLDGEVQGHIYQQTLGERHPDPSWLIHNSGGRLLANLHGRKFSTIDAAKDAIRQAEVMGSTAAVSDRERNAPCMSCGGKVEHPEEGWGDAQVCDSCANKKDLGGFHPDSQAYTDRMNAQGSVRKVAISDAQVRSLASAWHGGQSSPLYALSSSGAIVDGIEAEIQDCLGVAQVSEPADVPALKSLLDYVKENGPRGPQEGWSDQWDDSYQTIASKVAGWDNWVTNGGSYSSTINGYFCVLDNGAGLDATDGWRWAIYDSYTTWNYGGTPEDTSGSLSLTWDEAVADVTERASARRVGAKKSASLKTAGDSPYTFDGEVSSTYADSYTEHRDGMDDLMTCPHCGNPNFFMGSETCGRCGMRGDSERCGPNCPIESHDHGRKFFSHNAVLGSVLADILRTNPGLDRRLAWRVARKTVQAMRG